MDALCLQVSTVLVLGCRLSVPNHIDIGVHFKSIILYTTDGYNKMTLVNSALALITRLELMMGGLVSHMCISIDIVCKCTPILSSNTKTDDIFMSVFVVVPSLSHLHP